MSWDRIDCDVVVVGSGAAGLSAALGIAEQPGDPRVVVVTKGTLGTSGSSPWAQGGVAVAVGRDDAPALHAADTERVGCGLNDASTVRQLTAGGPAEIERLLDWGARFDLEAGSATRLALGREAGHRRRRIVHAGGDRTGAEVMRVLKAQVSAHSNIEVLENFFAADLWTEDGESTQRQATTERFTRGRLTRGRRGRPARVVGLWGLAGDRVEKGAKKRVLIRARATVLATGGLGQLYRYTTVPPEVTGDGIAMAARAGARLADLEFVQFHPTALARAEGGGATEGAGRSLPLLTEALRGDGAQLVDRDGRRFMLEVHSDAELAPRDVVARTLFFRGLEGEPSFLDLRPMIAGMARGIEDFARRFPNAVSACAEEGIDPTLQPVPVTPAAHYTMGGVEVDVEGRTSLDGLWACGEVTASGAHGANRLASNSLLEALVFGRRIADQLSMGDLALRDPAFRDSGSGFVPEGSCWEPKADSDLAPMLARLRAVMWQRVGLARDEGGLNSALEELDRIEAALPPGPSELANLVLCGRMVAKAALRRTESRGAHYRSDHPRSSAAWRHRQRLTLDELLQVPHSADPDTGVSRPKPPTLPLPIAGSDPGPGKETGQSAPLGGGAAGVEPVLDRRTGS